MKLAEISLGKFVDLLASSAPAPGGGSVAATVAACGAALTQMVALLTIGKKKYAKHDAIMRNISSEVEAIKTKLLGCIDKDTDAFNDVAAVFKMPKQTDEEAAARTDAMQAALKAAAEVPLEVMNHCLDALKITRSAVGISNTNAASDLGVAALNLGAAVKSAWLNVKINLGGIKDADFVHTCEETGARILAESDIIASDVYNVILGSLG